MANPAVGRTSGDMCVRRVQARFGDCHFPVVCAADQGIEAESAADDKNGKISGNGTEVLKPSSRGCKEFLTCFVSKEFAYPGKTALLSSKLASLKRRRNEYGSAQCILRETTQYRTHNKTAERMSDKRYLRFRVFAKKPVQVCP